MPNLRLFGAQTPLECRVPIPLGLTSLRWQGPVLLASGHRLMFLAAGVYAPVALAAWLLAWRGHLPLSSWWHGHELIFGFAVAAIAGFLQAAVPKWTQGPLFRGTRAGVLAGAWLLGRVGMALTPAGIPAWPLDLLFLPLLAGWVGLDILRAKNARNYQVVAILLALWGLDLTYQFAPPGPWQARALHAAVYGIVTLIALIGGRVVPSFTQNALRQAGHTSHACSTPLWLDRLAVPLLALVVASELLLPFSLLSGVVALLAALVTGLRMLRWRSWQTRALPLVWVLHVGYAFIPLGLLLKGISDLGGPIGAFAALHALTAGAIGVMILAVASRAALGHSGRPLVPSRLTVMAYVLVIAGALLRVFGVLPELVLTAGILWATGYAVFAAVYWPILTKPRLDGQEG